MIIDVFARVLTAISELAIFLSYAHGMRSLVRFPVRSHSRSASGSVAPPRTRCSQDFRHEKQHSVVFRSSPVRSHSRSASGSGAPPRTRCSQDFRHEKQHLVVFRSSPPTLRVGMVLNSQELAIARRV